MKKPISKSASKDVTKTTQKAEKLHPILQGAKILEPYKNIIKPYGIENF